MNQGGTAKLKLSPLLRGGSFFYSCHSKQQRGGGCVESDLVDLSGTDEDLKEESKNILPATPWCWHKEEGLEDL